jgi:tryptophan 2,3-dioxygenase
MSIDSLPTPATRPGRTVYETYLRTDELLSLQKPPEQRLHTDEVTFQVVHQTFELWWKITVEHLGLATSSLRQDRPGEAAHLLRRAVSEQSVVMAALRQLELVAPRDFHIIRGGLGTGSGGESPGFRAILRAAPKLWEAFAGALARRGVSLVDLYQEPRREPELYDCAEALTDFDEQFHLFRAAHLKLAQRHLGLRAVGTGGTPMPALEKTLHDLFFPQLWEARDDLLSRTAGAAAEPGAPSNQSKRVKGHSR